MMNLGHLPGMARRAAIDPRAGNVRPIRALLSKAIKEHSLKPLLGLIRPLAGLAMSGGPS
jgi:hypothetical protein